MAENFVNIIREIRGSTNDPATDTSCIYGDIKDMHEEYKEFNQITDEERLKLENIEEGATKNSTDAFLLSRENHTGTISMAYITDSNSRFAMTANDRNKLDAAILDATKNDTDANLRNRATHTGVQSIDTITDTSTHVKMNVSERSKLSEIATGATKNATDAELRSRSTHTGTQSADSIVDGLVNAAYTLEEKNKLSALNTDKIPEGSKNVYFTNERVDDRVANLLTPGANVSMVYNDDTNQIIISANDTSIEWSEIQNKPNTKIDVNLSGEISGSGSATLSQLGNGTLNIFNATLKSVGTAGTYAKVTTNARGQVVAGTALSAGDIPSLDASKITSGTIDPARLPSFVDDILEFTNLAGFPTTGETGKIYIDLDTNKAYRWSGSTYVYITSGSVDSVAGKTGVVTLTKSDVGLSNADNTSDANKPISTATQTSLNLKANAANAALTGVPTAPTAAVGTSTTQLATTAFVNAEIANDAPTKTGAGASGTWGINIIGNAVTATKLATARTINGVAFDGTANINITDDTKLPKTNPAIIGSITEQVYNLTGTDISPTNGTIQYKIVSANTTFTETLTSGQSVLLRLIGANSYTITFPTITWVGAVAPTLTANCAIVLWKEQSTLYGAFVGTLV